jgi:hypothetical protein
MLDLVFEKSKGIPDKMERQIPMSHLLLLEKNRMF